MRTGIIVVVLVSAVAFTTVSVLANDPKLEQTSRSFLTATGVRPVACPEGMTGQAMGMAHVSCGKLTVSLNQFKTAVLNEFTKRGWKLSRPWGQSSFPAADGGSPIPLQGADAWTANNLIVVNAITPPKDVVSEVIIFWVVATGK